MKSLFDKLWDAHVVVQQTADKPAILYIDLHLVHEVTSPQAFDVLRERGLTVRRPDRTLATMDHSIPTVPISSLSELDVVSETAAAYQIRQVMKNCSDFGIELKDFTSPDRGIVHVIGPELGATQPGKTIVCGDSHTSTHGAFGALAFGIGTTEVAHVLATQCMLQRKPKSFAINLNGTLQ
ncbi:MAG: aconitase family protein, partial [Gammaproteobacteria bacterium]|nr:aconitase family protein [Gammaproteobacteria bacterium]